MKSIRSIVGYQGRIGRLQFFCGLLLSIVTFILSSSFFEYLLNLLPYSPEHFAFLGPLAQITPWLLSAIIAPSILSLILFSFFTVRRLHDMDETGWFYFVLLVPVGNILLLIGLLFAEGSSGKNGFGEKPDVTNRNSRNRNVGLGLIATSAMVSVFVVFFNLSPSPLMAGRELAKKSLSLGKIESFGPFQVRDGNYLNLVIHGSFEINDIDEILVPELAAGKSLYRLVVRITAEGHPEWSGNVTLEPEEASLDQFLKIGRNETNVRREGEKLIETTQSKLYETGSEWSKDGKYLTTWTSKFGTKHWNLTLNLDGIAKSIQVSRNSDSLRFSVSIDQEKSIANPSELAVSFQESSSLPDPSKTRFSSGLFSSSHLVMLIFALGLILVFP